MPFLYAKIKQRGKQEKIRKVLQTDYEIFPAIDDLIQESVPYSQAAILENRCWYCIDRMSQQKYAVDLLNKDINSVDFDMLMVSEFKQLDYLFSISDDRNNIYFQNVGKSSLVAQKRFLFFGNRFEYYPKCSSVVIKDCPDAIYKKTEDRMYFRNLSSITGIFNGISELYREATKEETEKFLNLDFITTEGLTVELVKTPNRKRIALAMETLSKLESKQKKEIYRYIAEYCPGLSDGKKTFTVKNNEDLALVLYGIEQRFYTTPVGEEKRIANSVITLS